MILINKAKYTTITVIDVLENGFKKSISMSSIVTRQNTPTAFLEQIFSSLKKSSIVKSTREASGGYVLNRKPKDIKLLILSWWLMS